MVRQNIAGVLPAMQEMQKTGAQSLGLEDPLEEEMATLTSILAQRIPWTERGAWQAAVRGVARVHGVTRVEYNLVSKPPTHEQSTEC